MLAAQPFLFKPRELLNLALADEVDSLAPIMACHIADLAGEDTPQFYTACGRGAMSSLRVLRHGLEVSELAVSELPGNPHSVWTVKRQKRDAYDAYIVVSFVNATLVLSIGDTVEEVSDSGFLGNVATLSASQIGDDALLQVYADGIRHIRNDGRVNEWKAPAKRIITHCAVNERQVAIALAGGEIVYFEMDASGQLNEYTERLPMPADVSSMGMGQVPEMAQRSRFLAIGCLDQTVRVVSLDPNDCLQPLSMQALPAKAESLAVVEMGAQDDEPSTLFLNIGLENGVLLRTVIDTVTGNLSDTRTRYLGSRAVKLVRVTIQEREAVLGLSSRPWLGFQYQGSTRLTPLSYDALEHASSFKSEQCAEGIVAVSRNTLRILALERLGSVFNAVKMPLPLTPRKMFFEPQGHMLVIVEGDQRAFPARHLQASGASAPAEDAMDMSPDGETANAVDPANAVASIFDPQSTTRFLLPPKAPAGTWASNVRFVDPITLTTLGLHSLGENEMATSAAVLNFSAHIPDRAPDLNQYIAIGTVKDWVLNPQSFSAAYIYIYRMLGDQPRKTTLEFVHKTEVGEL